jgi:hypothetical protein
VTIGWIRAGVESGRIPTASYSPKRLTTVALSIVLETRASDSRPNECAPLTEPTERRLLANESFGVIGGPIAVTLVHNGVSSDPVRYANGGPTRISARAGPLDLRISPVAGATATQLCRD